MLPHVRRRIFHVTGSCIITVIALFLSGALCLYGHTACFGLSPSSSEECFLPQNNSTTTTPILTYDDWVLSSSALSFVGGFLELAAYAWRRFYAKDCGDSWSWAFCTLVVCGGFSLVWYAVGLSLLVQTVLQPCADAISHPCVLIGIAVFVAQTLGLLSFCGSYFL